MNQEITVLVISPNTSLFDSVSEGVSAFAEFVVILQVSNVSEAIRLLDEQKIKSAEIQIYLDCAGSKAEAHQFVQLLDRDHIGISRNSVVLIDDASSISGIVSLAIAKCVFDVLNYPVLPIEVQTTVHKRFPNLRQYIHSATIA